jgi:hypothetical protein
VTIAADALLEALAAGLRRRADEQRRAEERLAGFAFQESPRAPAAGSAAPPTGPAWRYHVGRALRTAGDLETLALLETLRLGPLTLDELAAGPHAVGDRLAVADWIGALSAAGFATRELETGRVTLAPLGSAILDLVVDLEARLDSGGSRP